MGCGSSTPPPEDFRKWELQFRALQLRGREINKLYRVFRKVDMDGSGSISVAELLTHIDVERTKFTERVFSIFDEDGSGEIDFREFVLSLWNYCTHTKATLGAQSAVPHLCKCHSQAAANEIVYSPCFSA